MLNLPLKPNGSIVEVKNELNRIELSWKNPRGGIGRYGKILFLLFWLTFWTLGGLPILQPFRKPESIFDLIQLFIWLLFWPLGELIVLRALYNLVRFTRPEKVSLTLLNLEFDYGTSNDDAVFDGSEGWLNGIRSFFTLRKKPWNVSKKDVGEIRLDCVGERQRLTFDVGADRIEIGAFLREPEREWLYEVLKAWKEGKSN